ncbi:Disease resistance protein (CC-NBS-LRR class) family [Euphorbia peplus]|nr:Disease resistance protein (CC-NBS-LRR class) family [Euphorbia peplus]
MDDICPLRFDDIQNGVRQVHFHSFFQQCPRRKRESSMSIDECPSSKRRSMLDQTDNDPVFRGMQNNQAPNAKVVRTIGVHLLGSEIVGKQFEEYIKDIWSCLMDDDGACKIGIHGIGGVGKTEVAKYINNALLQTPNKFHHVFWVSVSPDWSISVSSPHRVRDLQSSISKAVGVDLTDGDDETKSAAQLSQRLAEKKKSVLILDDVWDYIPLIEVGIPVDVDLCTVVITTRSLKVCRQLGCQKKIEMTNLPPDESFALFKKNLGMETTLSREVEEISRSVADKCVGLPLAITIMSRNMKGVTDISEWRNALRGRTKKIADMEIFQKLKTSYDYLKDTTLKHCFLYCLLLFRECRKRSSRNNNRRENCRLYGVMKWRLVMKLVDEGIIKRTNSRREDLDEAHTILCFLRDVGLLQMTSCSVTMNAWIRNMALQIMEENQQGTLMIKNGMSLKEVPDEESWTGDLVRVSLEDNEIENIPLDFSPSCSKLSTLLLSGNFELRDIGDSFFKGMPGLKILDLSDSCIVILPSSIYGLLNLTTLLLSCCLELRKIPLVAKLMTLKKLDLGFSRVEGVAEDIDKLSNLTYLDLYLTRVTLKPGVLASLSNLQFLKLPWTLADKGEELARLSRLEHLTCCFSNIVELNKYLVHLKGGFKEREPPIEINANVGTESLWGFKNNMFYEHSDLGAEGEHSSMLALKNCNINEADMLIYFEQIAIVNCLEPKNLCSISPMKGASELKYISIRECAGLEFLCSLSLRGQSILEKLQYMELFNLDKLSVLFKAKGNINASYGSCFSNLTRFSIQGCPSIKRLFPMCVLQNLKNLGWLYVIDCLLLEEIFAAEEEEEKIRMAEPEKKIICSLPKLRIIRLKDLPALKGVCGEGVTWSTSKSCAIGIENCPSYIFHPEWSLNGGLSNDYY